MGRLLSERQSRRCLLSARETVLAGVVMATVSLGAAACAQVFGIEPGVTVTGSSDAAADGGHSVLTDGGQSVLTEASCAIGPGGRDAATHVASGASNPNNPCQTCQPSMSTRQWTNVPIGSPCGTGEICVSACQAGCFIGEHVYTTGELAPKNTCQSCQPGTSVTAWTDVAAGTSCVSSAGMGICISAKCSVECYISGTYYDAGAANPNNPCQSCQPANSIGAWTNLPDSMGCGPSALCRNGTCAGNCVIDGGYELYGALNLSNDCQVCEPQAPSAWTDLATGTPCALPMDAGAGVCGGDASCVPGCFIAGSQYPPGATPGSPCQSCEPESSTDGWTDAPDGMSCGEGEVCNAGSCISGCYIGGAFYAPSAKNPAAPCESCKPRTSTSGWTTCAVCTLGACAL